MNKGTTFGDLAIGDRFRWRNTPAIQHGPEATLRTMAPLTKTTATRYEWSRGYGTAQPHYPVRKVRRKGQEVR